MFTSYVLERRLICKELKPHCKLIKSRWDRRISVAQSINIRTLVDLKINTFWT